MKKLNTEFRCPLTLTKAAKEKIRELGIEERTFFLLEKTFHIYMEKYPQEADRTVSVALIFDNKRNVRLADVSKGSVVVLHCIVEQNRFIATNMTTRPARSTLKSNWRVPVEITFDLNGQNGELVPVELRNLISDMPVLQESSMYVKKRIASWEGYLKIQEKSADIPDMTSRYSKLVYNDNFSRVTITGCQLNDKEWNLLKDLSVKLKGIDKEIGKVLKANRVASTVEVELHSYMEEMARGQRLEVHPKEVVFSNFATLSQVKRLRQGFKQLENGLAANPELERLLFEKKPPVKPVKMKENVQFHNSLNDFQKEAVIGALSAEDLYVIQGPPGTGKTTVISEICLQNAKAGLKTLVASQSNLAVDNALGRLLANKDIRILRVGRTESIEEEGKKFIEENVGHYWKDYTLQEVSLQFEGRKQREREIETEWQANEQEQVRLQQELARVQDEVEAKQEAEHKYKEIKSTHAQCKKAAQNTEQKRQIADQQVQEIKQSIYRLNDMIIKDQSYLAGAPNLDEIQTEWDRTQQEIQRLQMSLAFQKLEEEIGEIKQRMHAISEEFENWRGEGAQIDALKARITSARKMVSLKLIILEQNLGRSSRSQQLMKELDEIREKMSQWKKLKEYNDKLNAAISYIEQLLERHQLSVDQLLKRKTNAGHVVTSSMEIDQFLEKLRKELKENPKISVQSLLTYLEGLYGRRKFVWQKVSLFKADDNVKRAQVVLELLKQELIQQLQPIEDEISLSLQKCQREMDVQKNRLASLEDQRMKMKSSAEIIPNAREMILEKEANALELQKKRTQSEQALARLEMNSQKQADADLQLGATEKLQTEIKTSLDQLNRKIEEREAELAPLQKILSSEPEKEHENVLRKLASISFTRESLKNEKQKLPLFQSIQGKWLSLLEEANDHDLNEIRKLYVQHANVIGTTCVASARKDFIESYPVFDVVIIDEVSKATPPELLLPMLKGKKVILVGDHHQLPPLLGNDTLEEMLQEMADESEEFEGKAELKQLLKESLFERLFKNLPKENKTMLAIQYRMHEDIMETIAQFYKQENEGLQCGLADSDMMRNHLLESPLLQMNNHLLWMDMPNEPAYFEERMKGGKSLYNPAELKQIGVLLKELDEAAAEAKQAGRMGADERKSIGVISFYGEQVKRIDRLIHQELRLPHLTIRTGTVDRFQGMEMDVILLSMVRNHNHPQDDIGFAKDYRRLNVALSRARELLVLIGSVQMFTERTKHKDTRQMYQHVLDSVKKRDGLRTREEVGLHG